jgi:ABC-2 type transport system permease protein/sodium transport system permease protein
MQVSGRLFRLCRKELRETLRDRRTLLTLVLMPLLVYPVLSLTLQRFLISSSGPVQENSQLPPRLIAVRREADGQILLGALKAARESNEFSDLRSPPPPEVSIVIPEVDPLRALESGEVDLVAEVQTGADGRSEITLIDDATREAPSVLAEQIQLQLRQASELAALNRVSGPRGKSIAPFIRTRLDHHRVAAPPPILATIVPLMLVLMTVTGAVYPAIDLTAGERERGTMEALIASPIPRGQVLTAKYVAVVTVAVLTGLANLLAMGATLWAGGFLKYLVGDATISPWVIFQILALLVLFSAFFAAVLLALTSFARSFKEAQAYLIPLMLVSLAPGVLSLMPNIELTGLLAVVPLVNIVLLARDLLLGNPHPAASAMAVLSTAVYAAAALSVAARLFGSDALLGSTRVMWRRPQSTSLYPAPSTALLTFALLFPVYYVASNGIPQWAPESVAVRLVVSLLALVVLFVGGPLLAMVLGRVRWDTTLLLRTCHPAVFLGGLLMALGTWMAAHELFVLAEDLGWAGLRFEQWSAVERLRDEFLKIPPWLVILCLAVGPGICEELAFRGFLQSSLLATTARPQRAILLTALLFGVFHVVVGSVLAIERLLPTFLMGCVLGWIAYRARSIFPGMVAHTAYNGGLLMALYYRDTLAKWGLGLEENARHLPVLWLVVGGASFLVGMSIVWWSTRSNAVGLPFEREALAVDPQLADTAERA